MRFLISIGLAVLMACEAPPPAPSPAVSRDSAGVRIVQNASVSRLPVTRVPRRPLLRMGWANEDPLLDDIYAGVLLPSGGAAVVDHRSSQLYIIDPDGTASAHGGEGDGPGEFRNPSAVELIGDSLLVVWDYTLNRLSRFSLAGDFIDSSQVPDPGIISVAPYGLVDDTALGWIPTGYAVTRAIERLDGRTGWLTASLMATDAGGEELRSVIEVPIVHLELEDSRRNSNPFRQFGTGDVTADGFVWATNDRTEVRWIGGDGTVRQIARWEQDPHPVTDAVWDVREAWFVDVMGGSPEGGSNARVAEMMREAREDAPAVLPYFGYLQATRSGDVWLSEYPHSGSGGLPSRYLVVDSRGEAERWIELRDPIRVLDVSDDRILGVETDQWDVQAVVIYSISR